MQYSVRQDCRHECKEVTCTICNAVGAECFTFYNGSKWCKKCDHVMIKLGLASAQYIRGLGARGYCQVCYKKLVPIADRRANGTLRHLDWDSREYHKKCWKQNMKDGNNRIYIGDTECDDQEDTDKFDKSPSDSEEEYDFDRPIIGQEEKTSSQSDDDEHT